MAGSLMVDIVEPTGPVFRGEVLRFRAPGVKGSFEILRDHAPMLVETEIGPVFITTTNGDRIVFATSGGFVHVVDNRVIMIVESAELATEIDVDRAEEALKRAEEAIAQIPARSAEHEHAELALGRARNRLRIAMGQVGKK